jgi:autotransporter-associated beta strand protein
MVLASTGNVWGVTTINGTLINGVANALPTNAAVTFVNTSYYDMAGYAQTSAGVANSGGASFVDGNASQVGGANLLTLTVPAATTYSFGGVIRNTFGTLSLVLNGPGTQVLSGTSIYSGATTIAAGTLALANGGALTATTPIDVQAGATLDLSGSTNNWGIAPTQTLEGNGTVVGSLSVAGTVAPGESIGVLTITANAILSGMAFMEVNNAAATNDLLSVGGTLTYGGTLVITNTSGTAYTNNQVIQLFNAAGGYSGSFASIGFPGVASYDASNLTNNGTIRVLTLPAPLPSTPTNLSFAVVGGGTQMQLSWPSNYTGWLLQSNAVSVANTNFWFTVPGSSATNELFLSIDHLKTNVFYRMQHP